MHPLFLALPVGSSEEVCIQCSLLALMEALGSCVPDSSLKGNGEEGLESVETPSFANKEGRKVAGHATTQKLMFYCPLVAVL